MRRTLLLRIWTALALLFFLMTAYGLYEWFLHILINDLNSKNGFLVVFGYLALRMPLLAPLLLLALLRIFETCHSWLQVIWRVVLVSGALVIVSTGTEVLLRWILVDPVSGYRLFLRFVTMYLVDIGHWTILMFAAIALRGALNQAAIHGRLDREMRNAHAEKLKGELLRIDPRIILSKLKNVRDLISESSSSARSKLVELGDYLRTQLAHVSREQVTVAREIEVWEEIGGMVDGKITLSSSVDSSRVIPAGVAVAALIHVSELRDEADGVHAIFEEDESDPSLIRLTIRGLSPGPIDALLRAAERDGVAVRSFTPGEISLLIPEIQTIADSRAEPVPEIKAGVVGLWVFAAALFVGVFSTVTAYVGSFHLRVGTTEWKMGLFTDLIDWSMWGTIAGIVVFVHLSRVRSSSLLPATVSSVAIVAAHYAHPMVLSLTTGSDVMTDLSDATASWDLMLRAGYAAIFFGWQSHRRSLDRAAKAEEELRKLASDVAALRLRIVRSQLQPHFLLNSLHAVNALISVDSDRAALLCDQLLDLVAETGRQVSKGKVDLATELEVARNYMRVLKTRYGDRLEFEIHAEGVDGEVEVPALITQPILENAIVHGVEKTSRICRVVVDVRRNGDRLLIRVSNPAMGTADQDSLWGVGMTNTFRTLELCYGDDFDFEAGVVDGQYRVTLSMPHAVTHAADRDPPGDGQGEDQAYGRELRQSLSPA